MVPGPHPCSSFQGRSDGVDIGIYTLPPQKKKSAQVNFLLGKNDVRTAIQQFYTPKKLLNPQNKFLATPLAVSGRFTLMPVLGTS